MICCYEEILEVRKIIAELCGELGAAGIEHNAGTPLGAMIEIPSAALVIESLLKLLDFISVGTNDLLQYTLAVDRGNEMVSSLYQPYHPAMLNLLHRIGVAVQKAGKPTSICGEIAGDPIFTEMLLGYGFRELSMSPPFLMHVKARVLSLSIADAEKSNREVLDFVLSAEIQQYFESKMAAFLQNGA
jgi:phosphoenolpyruvate-protein kinase (PTS system EI component)